MVKTIPKSLNKILSPRCHPTFSKSRDMASWLCKVSLPQAETQGSSLHSSGRCSIGSYGKAGGIFLINDWWPNIYW